MTSTPTSPVEAPPSWTWILDEAAIRDNGGADDIALGVDSHVASELAYAPPDAAYERLLWEATRTPDASSSPPVQIAASAG
jgi:hypothetical protein